MFQGRYSEPHDLFIETQQLHEKLENKSGIAMVHYNLGVLTFYQGNIESALMHPDESLTLYRNLGDKWGIANALDMLASIVI